MPDVYGPFTAQTWTQAQWFRDAYARERSGVYAAAAFTASTVGDLALTVSGLTITMALGRAHVRGAGYERTGTAWSYTVPANTATNPRIDRLVLRRDLGAGTVLPMVLQGTPAASPAEPALTQTEDGAWDLPLFSWTTPANSGAPVTGISDERVPVYDGGIAIAPVTGTAALTVAANWTLNTASITPLSGGWAFLNLRVTRATTALTVPTNGDITNTAVGTIPIPSLIPPAGNSLGVPLLSSTIGRMAAGWLDTAGLVTLTSVTSGGDVAVSDSISLAGYYRVVV